MYRSCTGRVQGVYRVYGSDLGGDEYSDHKEHREARRDHRNGKTGVPTGHAEGSVFVWVLAPEHKGGNKDHSQRYAVQDIGDIQNGVEIQIDHGKDHHRGCDEAPPRGPRVACAAAENLRGEAALRHP